jgi:hypothetical protein
MPKKKLRVLTKHAINYYTTKDGQYKRYKNAEEVFYTLSEMLRYYF